MAEGTIHRLNGGGVVVGGEERVGWPPLPRITTSLRCSRAGARASGIMSMMCRRRACMCVHTRACAHMHTCCVPSSTLQLFHRSVGEPAEGSLTHIQADACGNCQPLCNSRVSFEGPRREAWLVRRVMGSPRLPRGPAWLGTLAVEGCDDGADGV
jgi:hypothetical protein